MITTGTIATTSLLTFGAVFARSGPDADPRVRTGAAVGIIITTVAGIIGAGVIVCLTAAQRLHDDVEAVRRDCDRELREVATLQRRTIARETYEMRRQLADWPVLGATDDTGPQPLHNR